MSELGKALFIDPRINAVGVSKLREMDAGFLRNIGENLYLIQDRFEPVAVLVSYEIYLRLTAPPETK